MSLTLTLVKTKGSENCLYHSSGCEPKMKKLKAVAIARTSLKDRSSGREELCQIEESSVNCSNFARADDCSSHPQTARAV